MSTLLLAKDLLPRRDPQRERHLLRLMTFVLGAALVVVHVEMSLIGVSPVEGLSTLEWLIRGALWIGPMALLLAYSNGVVRALSDPPTVWRTRILLWAAAVSVFSDRPLFALFNAVIFLAAAGLPAWYVTRVGWDPFLRVVAAAAGGLSVVSLAAAVAGMPEAVTDTATGTNRLTGIFTHPNQIGQIAGVALLCAWHERRRGHLAVARILGIVGVPALLWSQSRTSIVAALLAFGLIALQNSSRSKRVVGFLVGVACLVGVLYAGTDTVASQLTRTNSATELVTLTGRTELWATVVRLAGDQPLTGYGLGNERIADASAAGYISWEAESAHNDWLHIYLAFGLPGLAFWVAMWVSYARRTFDSPDVVRDALVVFVFVLGLTEVAVGPAFPSFAHYVLVGSLAAVTVAMRRTVMASSAPGGPPW